MGFLFVCFMMRNVGACRNAEEKEPGEWKRLRMKMRRGMRTGAKEINKKDKTKSRRQMGQEGAGNNQDTSK